MRLTPKQRGERIRAVLESKGFTATSAARKADLTYKTMKSILDGETESLMSLTVEKLAALDVPRHLLVTPAV